MNERKSNFHNKKSSITGEGRHSCAFVTQKATLLGLQFSRVKVGQIIIPSPFLMASLQGKKNFQFNFYSSSILTSSRNDLNFVKVLCDKAGRIAAHFCCSAALIYINHVSKARPLTFYRQTMLKLTFIILTSLHRMKRDEGLCGRLKLI